MTALGRNLVSNPEAGPILKAFRGMQRHASGRHTNTRVGIIFNRKAHGNLRRDHALPSIGPKLDWASPHTQAELSDALARFAEQKVDFLVIDGGDGTIRDVLTAAADHFPDGLPTLAIVPSGKTNALAIDLGVPQDWSLEQALAAIASGRIKQRTPIEIRRPGADEPHLRGFLFGAGAFVQATSLAQGVHGLGAFRGLAVGLSLAAAIFQTVFGGRNNRWRRGDTIRVDLEGGKSVYHDFYMILGSTLKRLPLGLRPFGRERSGFKLLGIDAPPRHVLATVPMLLAGSEAAWLDDYGYHRHTTESIGLGLESDFVLDGETYAGGDIILGRGAPVDFVVP